MISGSAGWFLGGLTEQDVRASTTFSFNDKLADRQPYLSVRGSWRGGDLANKVNTVHIICDGSEKHRMAKAVTMVRTKISREDACSIVQDAPLTLYLGEPLR